MAKSRVVYDQDVAGRLFSRNASLLKLLRVAQHFFQYVDVDQMTEREQITFATLREKISEYHYKTR